MLTTYPHFDNLKLTFLMQVFLSASLSRLYCVLGDFHMSTDALVQDVLIVI